MAEPSTPNREDGGASPSRRASFAAQLIEDQDPFANAKSFLRHYGDLGAVATSYGLVATKLPASDNSEIWIRFFEVPTISIEGRQYGLIKLSLLALKSMATLGGPLPQSNKYVRVLLTVRFGNMREGKFIYRTNAVFRAKRFGTTPTLDFCMSVGALLSTTIRAITASISSVSGPEGDYMVLVRRLRARGFRRLQ